MTTDDIIRMAREADLWGEIYAMQRFANLVAEAVMPKEALAEMFEWGKDAGRREEREACAKMCDGWPDYNVQGLAEAIRARGQE
jgi:hypothetical protein